MNNKIINHRTIVVFCALFIQLVSFCVATEADQKHLSSSLKSNSCEDMQLEYIENIFHEAQREIRSGKSYVSYWLEEEIALLFLELDIETSYTKTAIDNVRLSESTWNNCEDFNKFIQFLNDKIKLNKKKINELLLMSYRNNVGQLNDLIPNQEDIFNAVNLTILLRERIDELYQARTKNKSLLGNSNIKNLLLKINDNLYINIQEKLTATAELYGSNSLYQFMIDHINNLLLASVISIWLELNDGIRTIETRYEEWQDLRKNTEYNEAHCKSCWFL